MDATLSTYLIRPIRHGADIVIHSVTKFLAVTAPPSTVSSSSPVVSTGVTATSRP